jgi:hypothetical protein
MARRATLCALLLTIAGAASIGARQVRAPFLGNWPTNDAFFDDAVLHEVRLSINADDWQALKDRYLDNTYYPCDFRWRDQVVRNIGVRSRGTGSRSPIKPHLGLDFSRYVSDQRFLGLKSVVLRNNTQDASNLHERLTLLLFRRLGLPASRVAHSRLYVNNEYVGLYTSVESLDAAFLKRTFGTDAGYLYSYDYPVGATPYYFEYLGRDPGLYVPRHFKPETHTADPQPEVIEQMIWTINETNDAVFRNAIGRYLDVDEFLRHVAVDNFVTDNDGILGDYGMNNAYLYRGDGTTPFTFIPWDKSEAFKGGVDFGIFHNIADVPPSSRNRLMARLLSFADLRAEYLDLLMGVARSADEPAPGTSGPGWLQREIEREYAQVRESALADPKKPFTNEEFEQAVRDLLAFARERVGFIVQSVSAARRQTGQAPFSTR